jgi:hypothetical protein
VRCFAQSNYVGSIPRTAKLAVLLGLAATAGCYVDSERFNVPTSTIAVSATYEVTVLEACSSWRGGDCEEGNIEKIEVAIVDGSAFEVLGDATLSAIAPGTSNVDVTITRESGERHTETIAWTAAAIDHVSLSDFFPSGGRLYALRGDSIDSRYVAFDTDGNELAGRLPPFETDPPQYQTEENVLTIHVPEVLGQTLTAHSPIYPTLVVEAIAADQVTLHDFDDSPLETGKRRALEAVSRYGEHRVPGWPRYTGYTGTTCSVDVEPQDGGYADYLVARKSGTCTLTIQVAYGQLAERSLEITP